MSRRSKDVFCWLLAAAARPAILRTPPGFSCPLLLLRTYSSGIASSGSSSAPTRLERARCVLSDFRLGPSHAHIASKPRLPEGSSRLAQSDEWALAPFATAAALPVWSLSLHIFNPGTVAGTAELLIMDTPGAPGVVIKDVWELQEQIGKGSFAVVWKAKNLKDGRLAAVKEIPTERLNDKLAESLESEVAVLLRAKHPNIVELWDVLSVSSLTPEARQPDCRPPSPQDRVISSLCEAPFPLKRQRGRGTRTEESHSLCLGFLQRGTTHTVLSY